MQASLPDVSVFWVPANTVELFNQAYVAIAQECEIPGCNDANANVLSLAKTWLQDKKSGRWLIIIDNADDIQLFGPPGDLAKWIPECAHGSILITTRDKAAGLRLSQYGFLIQVGKMKEKESEQLLQEKLQDKLDPEVLSSLSSRLEQLPLAMVQAAAFIREMSIPANRYLQMLERSDQHVIDLLSEDFEMTGTPPEASRKVAETWIISFTQIQQHNKLAGELLSLMSLFDRQAIPEEFLSSYLERQQNRELSGGDIPVVKALGVLKAFSFIIEDKDDCFTMHRLVQLVTRKWLATKGAMPRFAEQALLSVTKAYPFGEHESRTICRAYLPHANAVLELEGTGSRDERLARAELLHCVAGFSDYQGLWKKAEDLWREAKELRTELLGVEHINTLCSMGGLALTYHKQGRFKEAETLEVQVLGLSKKVRGEEDPDTLVCMNNLSMTIRNQGRWEEAEELQAQVLKIQRTVLGEEHPGTLVSMSNLAMTYADQGRWKEAEELQLQALGVRKKVLGEEHPDTLRSMNNLASTYGKQGRLEEAERLQLQVLEIQKQLLGGEHPETLSSINNLASTYADQGQWVEAERLQLQVLEIQKELLGGEHPDTLCSMNNLAFTYGEQGRLEEAERLKLQVLEMRKRILGEEHPLTLNIMSNLAYFWKDQGRHEDALDLMQNCYRLLCKVLGSDHPNTVNSYNAITYWAEEAAKRERRKGKRRKDS